VQPSGNNRYGPKIVSALPLWGGGAGAHLIQRGQAEAYLHAKFHLDPSNCLATVHQRHRQTGQTDNLRLRFSMFADTARVTNVCIIIIIIA